MVSFRWLWLLSVTLRHVKSQSLSQSYSIITGSNQGGDPTPNSLESYLTYSSTITLSSSASMSMPSSNMGELNRTSSSTTSSPSLTQLVGTQTTSVMNGTANSSTSSSAAPTNTQACNNYPEFCSRKYSNITEVAAHNSPFVRKGNIFSNQQLDVTSQLDDGIRMLQAQTHYSAANNTLYLCHTSCNFLNVGTLEEYLTTVRQWVDRNRFEVLTILLGNFDYVDVANYTAPIQNSGLLRYLYQPTKIPMGLDDWPTLSEMILSGKRVVLFLDYKANQTKVPYVLDEFTQLWETPFSPTNVSFPCDVERPPNLDDDAARKRMYMANHNLNVKISIPGITTGSDLPLVPNVAQLDETNAVNGTGSLGLMANQCTTDWGRPPNFLLVDFYDIGNFNGSVFQVAAEMNNVTYSRECCGNIQSNAAVFKSRLVLSFALAVTVTVLLL